MFSESRITQIAAYLLAKAGGTESYLKLMKLLYLADRESIRETGDSLSHDQFVSMPQGPVLSQTLDLITNNVRSTVWSDLIGPAPDYSVRLVRQLSVDDTDELSAFDKQVLDGIHAQFGHMNRWEIRDWTHEGNCPEWQDPHGSSLAIKPEALFSAIEHDSDTADSKAKDYRERREIERLMSRYN